MSWHGGTDIMHTVILCVMARITSEEDRLAIYGDVYKALRCQDWHDGGELFGVDPVFDRLLESKGHVNDDHTD